MNLAAGIGAIVARLHRQIRHSFDRLCPVLGHCCISRINNLGAACLALLWLWLRPGRWPWVLVTLARLNPYLFVNVTIRGTWQEAMGQILLWRLAQGWLGLERRRHWGLPIASLAFAGIVLSNWNSTQLSLLDWGLGLLVLIKPGVDWRAICRWCLLPGIAVAVTAPF